MISDYEIIEVNGEKITADLLVWRRYRRPAPGILENMLDVNPDLARVHRYGPFLPIGMLVRIPIDPDVLKDGPSLGIPITLFGT